MKIMWKNGCHGKGDVEKIYDELEKLRLKKGDIEPKDVIQMAKPKRNPAHGEFIWDDNVAANAYRLEQARMLVRSIVVVHKETPQSGPQRKYVQVTRYEAGTGKNDGVVAKRVYTDIKEALKDPETRAEVLARAINEAASYRRRYAHLSELAVVLNAIDVLVVNQ